MIFGTVPQADPVSWWQSMPDGAWALFGVVLTVSATATIEWWRTKGARKAAIRDEKRAAFDAVLDQWTAFMATAALLMEHLRSRDADFGVRALERLWDNQIALDQSTARAQVYSSDPDEFARIGQSVLGVLRKLPASFEDGVLEDAAHTELATALSRARAEAIAQIRKELGLPPRLTPGNGLEDLGAQSPGDGGNA